MVLELHVPHAAAFHALRPLVPVFFTYLLSFVYLGIYWNNHHHMLAVVERVTGGVLWANLHLLFWLSLVPFTTAWMSENHFPSIPTATYGITLLGAAVAYYVLQTALLRAEGEQSRLARAIGRDLKGKASPVLYTLAIVSSLAVNRWVGVALYVVVALMWLVPDRRVERLVSARPDAAS